MSVCELRVCVCDVNVFVLSVFMCCIVSVYVLWVRVSVLRVYICCECECMCCKCVGVVSVHVL